ncbi:MAG: sulfate ABC transporter ATP-binding protein [Parvibaculum sp.]|nr:sulfate ABC transporter ATP-binding protein [Parvibaculum sp.]
MEKSVLTKASHDTSPTGFTPVRIEVEGLRQSFGKFPALNGVSLAIEPGELLALLGPSGSGKTTLLRAIAGLATPDDGRILFQGEEANRLSLRERRVGFVFQQYALFRHMTVFDNIAFGLRVRPRKLRPKKSDIATRVQHLLKLVQLDDLGSRFPSQLSGGQRQRVALARALAIEPRVLLLDEPFGALDAKVRKELRHWLRGLHNETGLTTIFVTHDQEEALELADRVVIMREGVIEQIGKPADIYDHPATPFVCEFLGNIIKVNTTIVDGLAPALGKSFAPVGDASKGPAVAYVRNHDVDVLPDGSEGAAAKLLSTRTFGGSLALEFDVAGFAAPVEIHIPRMSDAPVAFTAGALYRLKARKAYVFSGR